MISRRRFAASGFAVALVPGCANVAAHAAAVNGPVVDAIARVMLDGSLSSNGSLRAQQVAATIAGFRIAVLGLPPLAQADVAQLFSILGNPIGRVLVAGITPPWEQASAEEIAAFLNRWRFGGITALRAGYDALHQLVYASWYGNALSWHAIGYPGPPRIVKP